MPQSKHRRTAPVLPTHTPALFQEAVEEAAALLRAGEVVAVPTETVYGLAANALSAQAVERIFQVKGRPAHNPIIVHVAGIDMARECGREWPRIADRLAKAFWPGPLTLVLPRESSIPDVVTAGGNTVGVRWPSHPFHAGADSRLRLPAGGAERESFQSPLTHQRRPRCGPDRRPHSAHRGRRAMPGGNRIHRPGCQRVTPKAAAPGNDP